MPMKTKKWKPIANLARLVDRIRSVNGADPAAPLKGRGNQRIACPWPLLHEVLRGICGRHTETILQRGSGAYGKTCYIPTIYVSPELWAVLEANHADFERWERASQTLINIPLVCSTAEETARSVLPWLPKATRIKLLQESLASAMEGP